MPEQYAKPENIAHLARRLAELGYYPVPIPAGCKGPTIPGWDKLRLTPEQCDDYFPERGALVGVLHTNLLAIDIDVYDERLAETITNEAFKRFPGALERIGRAPKSALFFRMDEPGFKVGNTEKHERDGLSAQVEVRSVSRQIVAYGVHPETGRPYTWPRGELWATPREDLPSAKREDIETFRDWCNDQIRKWAGITAPNVIDLGLYPRGVQTDERPTPEAFKEALSYVSPSAQYDEWLSTLMAIHDFYRGSAEGLQVAQDWSSPYPEYTPHEVRTKWLSFETGKGTSYRTVFHLAKLGGADLGEMARKHKVTPETPPQASPQAVEKAPSGVITGLRIRTSAEFLSDLAPAVYVVDGVLAERRCLSLTGYAGHGKTTLAMHLAIEVARGGEFGGMECEQGSVLVLAGENPDNVKWQYAAAIAAAGCGNELPIHFLPGHFQLSAFLDDLIAKAEKIPNLRLVIIDSLQAFFEGENDNGNVEMMEAARRFRQLSDLDAGPTVLVIAHPAGKRPDKQNIVPRGGSAFSNELDGNLTVWSEPDGTQTLHHTEKFRGAPFDPLTFVMEDRQFDHLKDHKGRHMRLKVSRKQLDVEAASAAMKSERRDKDALYIIDATPKITERNLAIELKVSKSTARRVLQDLVNDKLIRRHARKWVITDAGKEFLNDA